MRYGHRDLIIKCRQRPSPSRLARGLNCNYRQKIPPFQMATRATREAPPRFVLKCQSPSLSSTRIRGSLYYIHGIFPRRFPRSPPLFPLSPVSFRTGRGEKLGRGCFVCNFAASSKMGDAVFGFVGLTVAEICRGMSPEPYTLHHSHLNHTFSAGYRM